MLPGYHDLFDNIQTGPNTYFGIRRCPDDDCKAIVFFYAIPELDGLWLYPQSKTSLRLDNVPKEIKEDALEAQSVFQAGAWKSTVVMCRRAVQGSCIERGAKPDNLANQIDELQANGLLTVQLKEWTHQIRKFGNFGAHPDENLGDATQDDATQMIEFLDTFLRYVYEMPAQIAAAQKRSDKSKAAQPNNPHKP